MNLTVMEELAPARGTPTAIPAHFKKYQVSWMNSQCQLYSFGHLLIQEYRTSNYSAFYYLIDSCQEINAKLHSSKEVFLLHYMLNGRVDCVFSNGDQACKIIEHSCQAFVLPHGDVHVRISKGVTEILHFRLSTSYLSVLADCPKLHNSINEQLEQANTIPLPPHALDPFEENLVRNELFTIKETANVPFYLRIGLFSLLSYYDWALVNLQQSICKDKYWIEIEQIKLEVQADPNRRSHTIDFFADKYHVSKKTLTRHFIAVTGKHFSQYLSEQCMLKAKKLLRDKTYTLDYIADQIGYNEDSHFISSFKRQIGATPNAYRKRLQ